MPRLQAYHDIHKLYGPKTRMNEFPGPNWKFLVHTAANLARAFRLIHRNGHVIGVNNLNRLSFVLIGAQCATSIRALQAMYADQSVA